jgi:regulator of sigma E protease
LGLHLSAIIPDLITVWRIALTVIALGMVIFVHELGHFVVAKLCGVKCEKFYLGFDIGGWKLLKLQWGETEYGIGILPLGGYVKMLGQEDNPARLREEIERAKQQQAGGADPAAALANPGSEATLSPAESEAALAAAEQALYDPRSYLAKSVPKRMAIISAGVIMNMIFAFVIASVAYAVGVKELACVVGQVDPGKAAWRAGVRTGDQILAVAGKKTARYRDLQAGISLGELDGGIPLQIRRAGVAQPLTIVVHPDKGPDERPIPTIGIFNAHSLTLLDERPVVVASAADKAQPKFAGGDKIIAIDDQPVKDQMQLDAQFAEHPDRKLTVTVLRRENPGPAADGAGAREKTVRIELPRNPMKRLGLRLEMGEITAVQSGSPAEKAGLQRGDRIQQIDDATVDDPETIAEDWRGKAGARITLKVWRQKKMLTLPATLRPVDWIEVPLQQNSDMPWPALGITYQVLNRVRGVIKDGPAARTDIHAGDVIASAIVYPPANQLIVKGQPQQRELKVTFGEKGSTWPAFLYAFQDTLPGSRIELTMEDHRKVTMEPQEDLVWCNPERGLIFEPISVDLKATSVAEAIELGGRETIDATAMVFTVLRKLGTQIPLNSVAGPLGIFEVTYRATQEGISHLLLLLTMLSANLAVLNFLPIPVLDGGHMVFLAYEGIRRKPANESVQLALTYVGLVFILGLMVLVLGHDIWRLVVR